MQQLVGLEELGLEELGTMLQEVACTQTTPPISEDTGLRLTIAICIPRLAATTVAHCAVAIVLVEFSALACT